MDIHRLIAIILKRHNHVTRNRKMSASFLAAGSYSGQARMMLRSLAIPWGAPMSLEDNLVRLRKGDLDALAALIEQYQGRLFRYLVRLLREPATAEDIFQQTWIRVA